MNVLSQTSTAGKVVLIMSMMWGLALAYSSSTGRVLYADGALYVLVHLTTPHRFDDYDFQRTFASVISQAPILFGQRLGLQSVRAYAVLYEVGTHVVPAVATVLALLVARKQQVFFAALALAAAIYGFSTNFINTEANLFFGFVWMSMALLANRGLPPAFRAVALPLCSVVLLRCYEGMLLAGPVLGVWAVMEMTMTPSPEERAGLLISCLLFFLGSILGLGGILAPRDPGNAAAFVSSVLAYARGPHILLLLSAIAVGIALILRAGYGRMAFSLAATVLGGAFVLSVWRLQGYYSFDVYYQNRAFVVLLLPLFAAGLLYLVLRRREWLEGQQTRPFPYYILLIPFTFAVAGDFVGTYRWQTYVTLFCDTLKADVSPHERMARLVHSDARMGWPWSHPALSVLLRGRESDAIVINEPGAFQWEPFDPSRAPVIQYDGLCRGTK